jgi:protein-disulfide isomerase
MDKNQIVALVVILVIALGILGGYVYLTSTVKAPTTAPKTFTAAQMVASDSPMTGAAGAKVTLVEWGDFECPFCGEEAPIIEQLVSKYGSNPDFSFVFRSFPLPQHTNARAADEAMLAANAQGNFYGMYQQLYANQNDWVNLPNPRSAFDTYAQAIGIDVTKFDAALDNHTFTAEVQSEYDAATGLGLDHTPSIFVNGTEQLDTSEAGLDTAIQQALGS